MATIESANTLRAGTGYDAALILDDGATAVSSGTLAPGEVGGAVKILDLLDGADVTDLSQIPNCRVIVNITSTTGDGLTVYFQASSSSSFAQVDESYPVGADTSGALTAAVQWMVEVRPKNRYVRIAWDGEASLSAIARPNPAAYVTTSA
jgi:hypothetical protein